jgi:ATP-binding cassette subfamily B protein
MTDIKTSPKAQTDTAPNVIRAYLWACRLAWRAGPWLVGSMLAIYAVQAFVPAVQSWIYKALVDGVAGIGSGASRAEAVWSAAGLYVLLLLATRLADAFGRPIDDQVSERMQAAMSREVLEIPERQTSLAFYDDDAVQNDLERVRVGLEYSLLEAVILVPSTLQQFLIVVTLSLLLARLHPALPVLLIATAIPRFRYEAWMRGYIWTGISGKSPQRRRLFYYLRVLLTAEFAKEVRLFGLGAFFLDLYRRTFESAHADLVAIRRRQYHGLTFYSLLNAAVTGAAYALIVLAAARREVTLGDVALYTSATFQLGGALQLVAQFYGGLVNHRLRVQAFHDLVTRGRSCVRKGDEGMTGDRGDFLPQKSISPVSRHPLISLPYTSIGARQPPLIEFRDVWFSYPHGPAPALRGINVRIEPGEKIAIVGENGAGKTTLVSLISRLYDPDRGEILVDGAPLSARDVNEWRAQLATVSQEFLRLEAPARVNLALGALSRVDDDASLRVASERVGLAAVLDALPNGLDQMLGRRFEGGLELSGGEWQKIALVRALLREEAGLILLDEPTSALDAPTEQALFRQFLQLAADRTTILISHRFSTVSMADRILFLEAGAIVEEGTHAELVARGGRYAGLFELQASRYR